MMGFFIINVWSIATIKKVFINLLAGAFLPIWFFPDWLRAIVAFTPFESIYFLPVQNYLGNLSLGEIAIGFTKQIIWLIILFVIGNLLYRKGKKRLIIQGG